MQARAHFTRISELIKPFAEEFVNVEGIARNALTSTCWHYAAANMRKYASKFFFLSELSKRTSEKTCQISPSLPNSNCSHALTEVLEKGFRHFHRSKFFMMMRFRLVFWMFFFLACLAAPKRVILYIYLL